jgi:cellulase/cellobiase CelA1
MKYPKVQVRLILEPDSLPNLATNFDPSSKCGVSTYIGYMSGIIKAIETLSNIPNVQILMDAAHSGWLGWCGAKTCRLD